MFGRHLIALHLTRGSFNERCGKAQNPAGAVAASAGPAAPGQAGVYSQHITTRRVEQTTVALADRRVGADTRRRVVVLPSGAAGATADAAGNSGNDRRVDQPDASGPTDTGTTTAAPASTAAGTRAAGGRRGRGQAAAQTGGEAQANRKTKTGRETQTGEESRATESAAGPGATCRTCGADDTERTTGTPLLRPLRSRSRRRSPAWPALATRRRNTRRWRCAAIGKAAWCCAFRCWPTAVPVR